MTRAILGRGDIVRALALGEPANAARIAGLIGYDEIAVEDREPVPEHRPRAGEDGGGFLPAGETVSIAMSKPRAIPFWLATSFSPRGRDDAPRPPEQARAHPMTPSPEPKTFHVLATLSDLTPRLRPAITARRPTTDLDSRRAVDALGQGLPMDPVPRETARRLTSAITVIFDRSNRLIPFWDDQDVVAAVLRGRFPGHRLRFGVFHEALRDPIPLARRGPRHFDWAAGGAVLVLGDLGGLERDDGTTSEIWRRVGQQIVASGCVAAALVPCPLARVPRLLRRDWRLAPWERERGGPRDQADLRARADHLLTLAASAIRIEPGLLRALRRSLPPDVADAGTEADVWTHRAVDSQSPEGASLHGSAAEEFRARFAALPDDVQKRALRLQRAWRQGLPEEIWYEEILNLPEAIRRNLPDAYDLELARSFFSYIHGRRGAGPGQIAAWLARVGTRATAAALTGEPEFARAVESLRLRDESASPRGAYDPILIAGGETGPYDILQVPGGFIARPSNPLAPPGPGSLVGVVRSANGLIRLDAADPFWASGHPPAWAKRWGWDDHGAWVTFHVGEPTQRMRWIPPGDFLMGSPEDEPGRWDDEGPQKSVTIADGFWMFDTPCTQALWTAVMGDNPSRFKGENRPVESVSFEDAARFIDRLNDRLAGLALSLPSEARWEYACRAGTTTAIYAGPLSQADVDRNTSPILDRIAWYYGNTAGGSVSMTPSSRADPSTSDDDADGGTRPVALKEPNAWGLYDTLGNVLEWCADPWNDNHAGAAPDGAARGASSGEARRVVRGGSWSNSARLVRAAYRIRYDPADRDSLLGFRCARVQSGGDGAAEAAPADRARRPGAERGRPPGPTGDAGPWLRVGGPPVPPPLGAGARITTDRDILTLERDTRPKWATAMGRDAFSLHAEFTVPGTEVTQRMRWIPPGRFAMGSPEDEPGRYRWEGPVHEVTLTTGYWLFDTPCTQALWAAVMRQVPDDREEARRLIRENPRWADRNAMIEPSYFKTPERPVESVSHEDLWTFIDRLNLLVPDLNLTLPSEAEWEYACRAGTDTATYAGPIDIRGENNAPVLESIAWYGGNSGVGFELDNGIDSSKWKEKEFPHSRAGTHQVKKRVPNRLGLFDMLGNVYEWCADTWHSDYVGAPADGSAWIDHAPGGRREARRVVRGGSWVNDARVVRAAYRNLYGPAYRSSFLGFRCARVQSDSERERRAVRSEPSERSEPAATNGPERAGLASLFQSRKRAPKAPRRKK